MPALCFSWLTLVLAWCLLCRFLHHDAEPPFRSPSKKCWNKNEYLTPHSRWPPICWRKPQCAHAAPSTTPYRTGACGHDKTEYIMAATTQAPYVADEVGFGSNRPARAANRVASPGSKGRAKTAFRLPDFKRKSYWTKKIHQREARFYSGGRGCETYLRTATCASAGSSLRRACPFGAVLRPSSLSCP